MTFEELKRLLFARSNFGVKLGLARMRAALALLGDPHRCAPALHVAGTNGKGSTCAFAEASLRAAGLRTGLYTSPHLRHFCERIRIGGAPISEETAAALLEELLAGVPWALSGGPAGSDDGDGLTFFEIATLLGFLAFARAGVQVMVLEVGMGGRLDATNVIEPLACAIAPVGLDHQQYLGATLAEIAAEKAGIFKPGSAAVTAEQQEEAALVVGRAAEALGVRLWRPFHDYRYERRHEQPFRYEGPVPGWFIPLDAPLSLLGRHQRQNAALACALLEAAARRGLPVGAAHLAEGLRTARWPGRLQVVGEAPLVLVDGAHNPHAARALADALPPLLAGRSLQLVFGALADKDAAGMLRLLLPLCAGAHFCPPDSPRAVPAAQLAGLARVAAPGLPTGTYPSGAEALAGATSAAGREGAVLACGSLYLVGELLAGLEGSARVPMPSERL